MESVLSDGHPVIVGGVEVGDFPVGVRVVLDVGIVLFQRWQWHVLSGNPQPGPCLRLAKEAMAAGGTHPAILNAANEVAVAAFLEDGLPYLSIPKVVEHCLNALPSAPADSLETILGSDAQARQVATQFIRNLQK